MKKDYSVIIAELWAKWLHNINTQYYIITESLTESEAVIKSGKMLNKSADVIVNKGDIKL